jgi:hypothetical protein
MNYSGIYVSMPVMKAESARDDDERSRREKQQQLERQLPRMRIADKSRSEKILADAMRTDSAKDLAQRQSELPKPSTARSLQRRDDIGQSVESNVRLASEASRSVSHQVKTDDHVLTSQAVHDLEERLQFRENRLSGAEAQDLHHLEERLQCRENPPSGDEILSIMKKLKSEVQSQNKAEREAMAREAEQADLLCSLDFIAGYAGALADPCETRAAIAEVIESLRGEIAMSHAGPVPEIKWQQEGILQLISSTDAKCTLRHDAAGHTQVVIEVNEEAFQAKLPPSRTPEPNRNKFNRDPVAGDDTLPLIVQRSI